MCFRVQRGPWRLHHHRHRVHSIIHLTAFNNLAITLYSSLAQPSSSGDIRCEDSWLLTDAIEANGTSQMDGPTVTKYTESSLYRYALSSVIVYFNEGQSKTVPMKVTVLKDLRLVSTFDQLSPDGAVASSGTAPWNL